MGALIFMGSKDAGLQLCQQISQLLPLGALKAIICPNDAEDSRSILSKFHEFGESVGIPVHVSNTQAETLRWVSYYEAKVALVHGWYQLIPVDGPCAFYGFHYSKLPKYRGNAPLVWQVINGEAEIGVSLFRFSAGMDEGGIVGQDTAELLENDTIGDALEKANLVMQSLVSRYLLNLVEDTVVLRPQPNIEPSYCGLRRPEDGKIDWKQSARSVHNFIRAQSQPYSGAFTFTEQGKRLIIWRASVEPRIFYGVPGAVVEVAQEWVVVACAQGALRLYVLEIDGSGPVSAKDILKSLKIRLK